MQYLEQLVSLGIIGFLGAMGPGPDFVVVTQHSLKYGKKAALFTILGIALGCLIHLSYCLIGVSVLIRESPLAFHIVKYLGGGYLVYIGILGLLSKGPTENKNLPTKENAPTITNKRAILRGFLVNLSNPKVMLFYLSIFTVVINHDTPLWVKIIYGLELNITATIWFIILTFILTYPKLRAKLSAFQHYIDRILGVILILFGIKVIMMTI